MRTTSVTTARADWYDRSPVARCFAFAGAQLAPAETSVKWSYTVPVGKKFALQLGCFLCTRDAAAAVAGLWAVKFNYTPNGGSVIPLYYAMNWSNVVGAQTVIPVGSTAVMLPGDVIEGATQDQSTGGSCTFVATVQGLEYDA